MSMKPVNIKGFGLIEVLVLIVVIGIAAATALQWMTASIDDIRTIKTEREMEMLSNAIVGDPALTQNGYRSDFGYIGDNGAFPANLQALYANPGLATWDGPYLKNRFAEDSSGYRFDEWETAYTYSGGTTITSTGSGATITKKLTKASNDYLLNRFNGTILDASSNGPGATYADSIDIEISFPNGSGGIATKYYHPESDGSFTLDSIPVDKHPLLIIYTPNVDTLYRQITILPRHKYSKQYKFSSNYFSAAPLNGPAGHWKLDDSTGTTALDDRGLNHGALYNMVGNEWVAGQVDGALEFNGSDDYISIPHSDSLDGSTELTYAAWIYPHSWSGSIRQVMAKSVHGGGSGRAQMGIFSESGSLYGRAETFGGRHDIAVSLPALDSWTHVAIVFNNTSLSIYINGSLANSMSFPATTLIENTDELCISKRVGTDQYFFDGLIDDVRVYTRVLTAGEILALSNM